MLAIMSSLPGRIMEVDVMSKLMSMQAHDKAHVQPWTTLPQPKLNNVIYFRHAYVTDERQMNSKSQLFCQSYRECVICDLKQAGLDH